MRIITLFLLVFVASLSAELIPKPRKVEAGQGELVVDVQTTVIAAKNLSDHAEVLRRALERSTGYLFRDRVKTPEEVGRRKFRRAIRLGLADEEREEFYRLEITPQGVSIIGSDRAGLMHGVQSFVQLLPVGKDFIPRSTIPAQVITDWPAVARRIFHLDVSAHLFPTDDLKEVIDWLSFHKLNEFHLQLNGDAGWRMESLKFPKLHEIGSVRASSPPYGDRKGSDSTEYGGYYTQENLKELAAYGTSRGVEVVPAFTFVEGAAAIIAAYPELGKEPVKVARTWEKRTVGLLKNEASLEFVTKLCEEVAGIFPSRFVRLEGAGGELHEEVKQVLELQKKELVESEGLVTSDLSVYGRPRAAELLLGAKLEAAEGFNPVHRVFELDPGKIAQASLHTEFVHDTDKLQYLVFPRLAAFASATWETEERKYDDFRNSLDVLDRRYRAMKVKAAKAYDPPADGALGGTVVTSSLEGREGHAPNLVFDGKKETFFWSREGLKKGDHLTLEFPWVVSGAIEIATGRAGGVDPVAPGVLVDGVVEFSPDGIEWDAVAEFFDGLVAVAIPAGSRFVRIRVTGDQDDLLVLHEVGLSEPLLMPRHLEKHAYELPVTGERIELTFWADFEKHPELRGEIETIRRIFFTEWFPVSHKLGLAYLPKTSREFVIAEGEPGEMTAAEAREWFMERWLPQLQSYPADAPKWFTSGMVARVSGDLPAKPNRLKNLDGGPETAAFLEWLATKHGEELLGLVSQDCRGGRYRAGIWKTLTKSSLEELSREYQSYK